MQRQERRHDTEAQQLHGKEAKRTNTARLRPLQCEPRSAAPRWQDGEGRRWNNELGIATACRGKTSEAKRAGSRRRSGGRACCLGSGRCRAALWGERVGAASFLGPAVTRGTPDAHHEQRHGPSHEPKQLPLRQSHSAACYCDFAQGSALGPAWNPRITSERSGNRHCGFGG